MNQLIEEGYFMNKSLSECKKGNHQLQDVWCDYGANENDIVIRWCKVCGSVTVDLD